MGAEAVMAAWEVTGPLETPRKGGRKDVFEKKLTFCYGFSVASARNENSGVMC